MRTLALAFLCGTLLTATAPLAYADPAPPVHEEHPGEVALVEGSTGYLYLHFPSSNRLYVYDKDKGAKTSTCNDDDGCAGVWPPLIAPTAVKPMGDWTKITRDDTRQQWAYKGRPVYLHFHDSPEMPVGDGAGGVWHFLQP